MINLASFFHAYDLRGKYPEEIGEEEAEKVGKAFGTFTEAEKVLVGRDGRTHGEKIKDAFIRGVNSTGVDVLDAGGVPTPVIYQGMRQRDIDASAVITASHNPPEYTGFKFSKKEALAMSREGGMKQIEQLYELGGFESGNGARKKVELEEDYIEVVKDKLEMEESLEIAVNYGNGVGAGLGEKVLERIGCD
ncbi:MAG: phosphomannomutase, partial [Nanohaloarchaea archaeon SW_4_43_9]